MTYPPQQPENGWSDNQQQPQQPVDPFAQPAPGHQDQPVDPFGQPPQQYGRQSPYANQDYGQPQYHDEIPTDQTQAYGEPQHQQQGWGDAEHTQVIGPGHPQQGHPQQGHPHQGQAPHDADHTQMIGHGQAAHGHPVDADNTQVLGHHAPAYQPDQAQAYEQQPPVGEHTQILGQRRTAPPPIEENTQVIAHTSPVPPHQAPVSASPAFGQPYGAPVSASPASGQPHGAPVSASPASGHPYGPPVSASPASGQPFGAPVSASPSSGQFSPFAETPPGVPASPFTPAPAVQPMSGIPASGQPWSGHSAPQFTPKKRRGLPSWVYVVGVVVIVGALAASAIVYFGIGQGQPSADPTPTPTVTEDETLPLLTEQVSGLGYYPMGDPWGDLSQVADFPGLAGFSSFTGQYVTADTDWMALFAIGTIDMKAVDYETNAIRGAVEQLATLSENQTRELISEGPMADRISGYGRDVDPVYTQLRVDGRSAGFITYHVAWEDSGSNETGSTVTIGVIDIGDGKLAGFVIDIPDTLKPAIAESAAQAMNTLQFS